MTVLYRVPVSETTVFSCLALPFARSNNFVIYIYRLFNICCSHGEVMTHSPLVFQELWIRNCVYILHIHKYNEPWFCFLRQRNVFFRLATVQLQDKCLLLVSCFVSNALYRIRKPHGPKRQNISVLLKDNNWRHCLIICFRRCYFCVHWCSCQVITSCREHRMKQRFWLVAVSLE